MSRKIISITPKTFRLLPRRCTKCCFWESPDKTKVRSSKDPILKETWFSNTLLQWGECGKLLLEKEQALAYAQFGPPAYFPKIELYPRRPSNDAVFLSCLYVSPELQRKGLGKLLLQTVLKDLSKRKLKAIEALASYSAASAPGAPLNPIEFYLSQGFYILKDHPTYPLLRLDFKSIAFWQTDLQTLLESLKLPLRAKAPAVL